MIDQLEIENLKSLAGKHCVELAPITLVYGANSSGKSSLLQALALLKQTLESPTTGVDVARQPLNLRGELIDLGSFSAAVHKHSRQRWLRLGVGFSAPALSSGRPWMRPGTPGYVKLGWRYDSRAHTVEQREVTVGQNGRRVRFVPAEPSAGEDPLYTAHERFFRVADEAGGRELLELVREAAPGPAADELAGRYERFLAFNEFRPLFRAHGSFPETPWLLPWYRSEPAAAEMSSERSAKFAARLRDLVFAPAVILGEVLKQLAYLGPLRAAPTRFQARSGAFYTGVGARGEHTPLFLLQHQDLLGPVNQWLKRLDIHYRLQVSPVKAEGLGSAIGDLVVTRLQDTRTNVELTPQDVGFGISQLLPIVVEVLAGRDRTICIEQPEIHIHPRMQTELADLFIEAARLRGNQLLIETHSEHLMLRMLRRIRESAGAGWLRPDKVCVLYVSQGEAGTSLPRRLHINASGEFVDEWPNGFFTERIEELFASHVMGDANAERPDL